MNEALRARVLAASATEASPTRGAVKRRNALLAFVGVGTSLGTFMLFAALMADGHWLGLGGEIAAGRDLARSPWLAVTTAGGALGIAAAASWLALARGGSMLGRSRAWLVYGGLLVPISLFVWKVVCSASFGDPMVAWPSRPGLRCLALSLLVAVGPLLSFLAIRRSAPVRPALNGAVLGLAAGACAWLAVDLWCPVAYVPHLLIGHVLPLLVLAGAGALLAASLISPRGRP